MSSSQNLVEALLTQLTTAGGGAFNTLMGGRIYHPMAPQGTALPLLVFDVLDYPLRRHFGGSYTYEAEVHFDIWQNIDEGTAGATGVGPLEETLFLILDGVSLTVSGQDRGLILVTNRGVRTVEEDGIRISVDATVTGWVA